MIRESGRHAPSFVSADTPRCVCGESRVSVKAVVVPPSMGRRESISRNMQSGRCYMLVQRKRAGHVNHSSLCGQLGFCQPQPARSGAF